mmetsp:Transcript_1919/g.3291  ORF Transcript_1919/g.3291 Transcript_1919/m.3291 type:complete len:209 (-) Transcript_1919:867-1493(-)
MQTDDVHADDLLRLLVEQHLGNALALVLSQSLGVGLETARSLAQSVALRLCVFLGLLLSETNHGNLWVSEASSRNGIVVDHVGTAYDVLNSRDTMSGSSMGKHHQSVCVTNAPQTRHDLATLLVQHLHLLIDLHKAAHGFNTHGLQTNLLGIRHTASCHHACIHLKGLHVFLSSGVNHLDGDGLFTKHSRNDLRGKDVGSEINVARLD